MDWRSAKEAGGLIRELFYLGFLLKFVNFTVKKVVHFYLDLFIKTYNVDPPLIIY